MKKKSIYIDVRHSNYWCGVYNFEKPTSWEDVIIYEKRGKGFRKLAWTCISSSTYLRNGLNDLKTDEEEKEFVDKISFIKLFPFFVFILMIPATFSKTNHSGLTILIKLI